MNALARIADGTSPRPLQLDDDALRAQIAAAVSAVKAYDLAAFCSRIGLDAGDDQEASASKSRYVLRRLEGRSRAELLEVADRACSLRPSFALEETIELARQGAQQQVSELTRRAILDQLQATEDLDQLGGKLDLVEFLGRVWPLDRMPSEDHRCQTAAGEIAQHTVLNPGDYSFHYLLAKRLGLLTASDRLFLRFVEALVHPLVRDGDRQQQLVAMLNEQLAPDGLVLVVTEELSGHPIYRARDRSGGVAHAVKNLIFAADGPKPDLVLADAVSNEIRIVRHAEHCLVFDEPIPPEGLTWTGLLAWWARRHGTTAAARETEEALYRRLEASLDPAIERPFLFQYLRQYRKRLDARLPALVPQVYLHYDPLTVGQRARAAARAPGGDGIPSSASGWISSSCCRRATASSSNSTASSTMPPVT